MNEAALNSCQVPDEPPADADPSTVCAVRLRGPNGEQFSRRFEKATARVSDLASWYKKETKDMSSI